MDKYPAIEFDDGTWYRDESKKMAAAIRDGRLDELHGKTPAAERRRRRGYTSLLAGL